MLLSLVTGRLRETLRVNPFDSSASSSLRGMLLYFTLAGLFLMILFQRKKSKLNVPVVLVEELPSASARIAEYDRAAKQVMWKGTARYPDQVWGITTQEGVKIVVPMRFLKDLKSHPALSFKAFIDDDMMLPYTFFGAPTDNVLTSIKVQMTPSLPAYVPILQNIIREALAKDIGQHNDWTPIAISPKILRVVGIAAARVFYGSHASKNELWLDISMRYIEAVGEMIKALKSWPAYLRPVVHRFLPQRRIIDSQWKRARAVIASSLRDRRPDQPPSMMDNLTSGKNAALANDVDKQTLYQMTLVAVGAVTNFITATHCVYDLAAVPSLLPVLRKEVLESERDSEGLLTKTSLTNMTKMDSVMKESQRLNGTGISICQRTATADLTLPDGTFVPKGTVLESDLWSMYTDAKNFEDPFSFDGLRYHRARQASEDGMKHLFTGVTTNDLAWGFGRHACPGRYLSEVIIKLLLSEMIMMYDFKVLDGEQRSQNIEYQNIVEPNPETKILIMSRDTEGTEKVMV